MMIGMYGGFTTFSSFSLQTLELFRDDRAGQAGANIALSIALYLAGWRPGTTLRRHSMGGGGDSRSAPRTLSVSCCLDRAR